MSTAPFLRVVGAVAAAWCLRASATRAAAEGPAERWVLEQVAAGSAADLEARFPAREDRVLSATFLKRLLTSPPGSAVQRAHRMRIEHAVVKEPLDMSNQEVDDEVRLDDCEFESPVTFDRAKLSRQFSADGATFHAAVSMWGVRGLQSIFLRGATFAGPVDFGSAHVSSNLEATGAKFADTQSRANFNSLVVGHSLFIDDAEFAGSVDFVTAHVVSNFQAAGAKFTNAKTTANFNSLVVDHTLFITNAEFSGAVDFGSARVSSNFDASGAKFTDPGSTANFNSLAVGQTLFLENAEFAGPVNFVTAHVVSNFQAAGAKFTNAKATANFNSLAVDHTLFITDAEFSGGADFGSARITSNFEATGAKFGNTETTANFNSLDVGQNLFINRAEFAGPVDFLMARVASNLEATGARFTGSAATVNFDDITVRGVASLGGGEFAGGVSLEDATLRDLLILGKTGSRDPLPSLDLSRTTVQHELRLERLTIGTLRCPWLRVNGPATFDDLSVETALDAQHAHFTSVEFQSVPWWLSEKADVRLEGLTYAHASAGPDRRASEVQLLNMIEHARYSTDTYAHLEEFTRKIGDPEFADDVYVRGQERQRHEALRGFAWLKNLGAGVLVRHGRSPHWALYWSLPFILVGYFVFRRRDGMEPTEPKHQGEVYSPGWYVIDLFLPFINLQMRDVWRPSPVRRWARAYARVLVIAGWILVPLGLAALTGLLK